MIFCTQVMAVEVAAPAYQWIDEQGQVHFGDKPDSALARPLELKPPPVTGTDRDQQAAQRRLLEVMAEERQQHKLTKEQQRAQQAERQRGCDKLAKELKDLQKGRFVYYRENAAGEREYIDDAARSRRAEEYRILFERECS